MDISRVGVHRSVNEVFPAAKLVEALDDAAPTVTAVDTAEAAGCDAVVTLAYEAAFLDAAWIHSIQAGVDRFPFEDLERAGVVLTNSTGIHGDSVGETVAGYMLMFARRLHEAAANQADREWASPPWDTPFTLDGESVCVVGLGTLGRGIAVRADRLGMRVTGVKRTVEPVEGVERVYPADDLHEAIRDARFVALAVPLTAETEGLIGPAELAVLREDAVLINVARGAVVDQDALIDALEADRIGGAALDVFEVEPLPEDSPLWDLEAVIVTPHIAAATRNYYRAVESLLRENLDRIERDADLTSRVV
jgi:D-2-hydroxyacid dehydrogenase (NADP+)